MVVVAKLIFYADHSVSRFVNYVMIRKMKERYHYIVWSKEFHKGLRKAGDASSARCFAMKPTTWSMLRTTGSCTNNLSKFGN
ncbi:hypothetical protein Ahy_B08g093410 isoform B [Arachis hypogaea]|uniref:Uncharacterized protein n=1 Tax=Arachis hypogaea TaxID=3818 RepID=A0A444Y639_ARAHY|nr:hypothetical protein Ahy_B08g093410 isoform B [Arachis hypogaea]